MHFINNPYSHEEAVQENEPEEAVQENELEEEIEEQESIAYSIKEDSEEEQTLYQLVRNKRQKQEVSGKDYYISQSDASFLSP